MEVLESKTHKNCFHCEDKTHPTVEIRQLEKGHEAELFFCKNKILFVNEGEICFTFRSHFPKTLQADKFIFIPVGGTFRYVALENTTITIVRFNGQMTMCGNCFMDELYPQSDKSLPNWKKLEIRELEITRPLQLFMHGLHKSVNGGLNCRYYFDLKAKELLILLRSYYPIEDLQDFFLLILSPDASFAEHVRANHHRYQTIKEMAESMNITQKTFVKVFSRVFGMPPGKWLNSEKAQIIYDKLYSGNKSFKEIAFEHGFSTQQQFHRFCKRELGKNPSDIRRDINGKKTG